MKEGLMKRIIKLLALLLAFSNLMGFEDENETARMNAKTFAGLKFRGIGPALMSGRIADIAVHPNRQSTWYVAVGSGGVWKTVNAGTSWNPIFDKQPSYSIGCVTIDPKNPAVVWIGTGENVSGRHVGYGDGIYRSLDGGESWNQMGLQHSEHISKILISPKDSRIIFAAAEGPLWNPGGERGVYRSTDSGASWEQVLKISEDTGFTDLEFSPRDPEVLYAAAYQRRRSVALFLGGGPESGIYKSSDGGDNWRKVTKGLPKGDMGKIGLAVSTVDPSHVYATIEATPEEKGFYRSTDGGESWEKRSDYVSGGTGEHYYQEIYASPHKLGLVYQMDVRIHVSEDGGKTFVQLGEPHKHSDNHALVFDPKDPEYLLVGSDGGIYETWDHGRSWKFAANLPVTQFYKLGLDNDYPFYNIVGGTQDNSTQLGPSRTLNRHGIRNEDWILTLGGDGHGCQIDPEDPNIVYSEMQVGRLSRLDKATEERLDIQPQPGPNDPPERWNWDAPILISPHLHTRLYFGSQRLWRSDDRGDSWTAISPDLTRNQNRYELKIAGRVWTVDAVFDHSAMSFFNTTTSISESPIVEGLIFVGTDDGLIQITENGGKDWRRVDSLPGVPELFYVNEVKASVHDSDTVFVAVDNHKTGDYRPYLFKSIDRGRTWESISGDLPERHLVWSVVQDHVLPDLLFAGTEFGIFFTSNAGQNWIKLTGGVPTISFRDLEIQRRDEDLVGASFGRGFYILDDYSPLREVNESLLEESVHLFPVRKALLYVPRSPLGESEKASQGAAYFGAPNPPFGAIITYYLAESLNTSKEKRREKEKEVRKAGGDVTFPGWKALQEERRELKPQVVLTVSDPDGKVVRRIMGPATKGFHRVAWDLKYPAVEPVVRAGAARPEGSYLVLPGVYTVNLSRLVNGVETEFNGSQTFEVVALGGSTLQKQDPSEVLDFQRETGELLRRALGAQVAIRDASERLQRIRKALILTPSALDDLLGRTRQLETELSNLRDLLEGDPERKSLSEPASPGIIGRLRQIVGGHWSSTYGPTQTHRMNYEIALRAFEDLRARLEPLVEQELVRIERDLEAVRAPYTSGRTVP
jgi:photosystem II stability/assembly factor-like uncharacterized protein